MDYATADGTARAGSDYDAVAGTLTFAPGETTKTITVWVLGDRTKEADETFYLDLWGAANADVYDGRALGTILDDGDDILIAGTTAYDGLDAALCAVMDEWTSDHTYEQWVRNLTDGTGTPGQHRNGAFFLIPGVTVWDDGDEDKLTGPSGHDWFFRDRERDDVVSLDDDAIGDDLDFILG